MLRDPTPPAPARMPAASPAIAGHRPLELALALAICFAAAAVRAQPTGAQVVHGSAVMVQNGSSLTVTTQNGPGTQHSAINWQSFNVPAGSSTWFQQPGAGSTSINRVVGPDPSSIFGRLGSNGRLVLVNPAGIAVGAGAVVDTAGFTASTLRMSDADAVAGRQRFAGDGAAGPLSVQGHVVARGGDVVLIAPRVEVGAQAVVEAQGGAAILAAGQAVEITGRGLEGIHFDVQAPAGQAVNLGTLKGDAVGMFAGTLRHSGLIQAQTATLEGGKVVLLAGDITLDSGAVVEASGLHGGGTVLVGGDRAGAAVLAGMPNARDVQLAAGSVIRADALGQGDGGRVIVWGEATAGIHGAISARGGPAGGNGGFVETSARFLDVTRGVDVSAPRGRGGRWLLDPEDVDIGDDATDNITSDESGEHRHPSQPRSSRINASALESALNTGGTVVISTEDDGPHGNGTIRVNRNITKTSAESSTLELHANRDIRINGAIRSSGEVAGVLNLVLDADSDRNGSGTTLVKADIDTRGGVISAPAGAPMVGFGDGTGRPLTLRARLGGGSFGLNADLCDSELVLQSGTLDWWGGATLVKTTLAVLPQATLNISNLPDSPGLHRLSHSELWNFGSVRVDDGAGDLVIDNGSQVQNAILDDAARSRFGGAGYGSGMWQFAGNAMVRGTGGTFRNQGTLFKGTTSLAEVVGAGAIPDATTTTIEATGLDLVLEPGSLLAVASGTLRLARSPMPSDTPFVNQGLLFLNTGATLSTEGHPLTNTADGFVFGDGTIVTRSLRNDGILFPGLIEDEIGTLSVTGNFVQGETGRLFFALRTPASYAHLNVSGSVSLAGTVIAAATEDAAFAAGDRFDVIAGASSSTGTVAVSTETPFTASTQPGGLRLVAGTATGPAPPPPSPPPTAAPTPAPSPSAASSPAPTPTPAPTPAPSPAPAPPPATQAERMVEILQGEATVAQAQESVTVMDGTVGKALDEPIPRSQEKKPDRRPADDGKTCR